MGHHTKGLADGPSFSLHCTQETITGPRTKGHRHRSHYFLSSHLELWPRTDWKQIGSNGRRMCSKTVPALGMIPFFPHEYFMASTVARGSLKRRSLLLSVIGFNRGNLTNKKRHERKWHEWIKMERTVLIHQSCWPDTLHVCTWGHPHGNCLCNILTRCVRENCDCAYPIYCRIDFDIVNWKIMTHRFRSPFGGLSCFCNGRTKCTNAIDGGIDGLTNCRTDGKCI